MIPKIEFEKYFEAGTLLEEIDEAYKEYLRIEFAKSAMQGMLSSNVNIHDVINTTEVAVKYADQLIKELKI